MGSKDFGAFMDNYIDDIRSKKPGSSSLEKNKDSQELEDVPEGVSSDSVYIIKKPKTWWQKLLESFTSTDEEDFEEKKAEEKNISPEKEQEFQQELEEMDEEEKKKGFFQRLFSFFSSNVNEAYEEIDEEEKLERDVNEAEAPKQALPEEKIIESKESSSFWQRFLNFFGLGYEEVYDEEQPGDGQPKEDPAMEKMIEIKEDMKEIAVIATATFKKLPKEQFKMFKESADFAKFKSILSKHNIIKIKE